MIKCINYIPIEKEKIENIVKNIFFIGINPVELSLVDYFDLINEQECKINPSIVMDMSLDTIYELSGEESLFKSLNFSLINKRVMKKITGFYLINGLYKDVFNFPLYTIYDNIVYVKPYKNNRIIVKPIKMMNSLLPRSSIAINPDEIKYCMQ